MSSQTATASPIHPLYRFWFTGLDPLLTLIGIYCNIMQPNFILAGLNPAFHSPPAPETITLLDTGGAWFCACLIFQLGLLRARPTDVLVWHYFAAAVGVVDVIICSAILRGLSAQGRLDVRAWRVEEWVNLGVTAACAVVRAGFVLRIGVDVEDGHDEVKTKAT
jgi:hypothetical protein